MHWTFSSLTVLKLCIILSSYKWFIPFVCINIHIGKSNEVFIRKERITFRYSLISKNWFYWSSCLMNTKHPQRNRKWFGANIWSCILICRFMQNTTTQWWRQTTQFLEKYTSHFIWKVRNGLLTVLLWEGVRDRTELQHIDPRSYGHQCCVFLILQGCSTGGLRAHSAGCWLSLPHLVTNGSGLQTNWLPLFTELYNSSIAHSIFGMACLIVIKRR